MTPLPQRLIEDIQLRGLSERTQDAYGRAVRQLAHHSHTSPARITEAERRDDLLSLTHVPHASRRASTIALCGITCFYAHPRTREWSTLTFGRAPREQTLPVLLSAEAVRTLRAPLTLRRSRACLTPMDACGLRRQEGTPLQGPESDRARLLVHVQSGKDAQDRSVPLPQRTLAFLRPFWHTPRHPVWLFPAPGHGGIDHGARLSSHAPHQGPGRLASGPHRAWAHYARLRPHAAPPLCPPSAGSGRHSAPSPGLVRARRTTHDGPLHAPDRPPRRQRP